MTSTHSISALSPADTTDGSEASAMKAVGHFSRQQALSDRLHVLDRQLARRETQLERTSRDLEIVCAAVAGGLRRRTRMLARIKSSLDANVASLADADTRRDLANMAECVRATEALIDSLLDLIEVARQPLAPTSIDLTEMALSLFERLNAQDPQAGIVTSVQPALTAYGDATLIGLALRMLVTNAWKTTRECTDAAIAVGASRLGDEVVYYVRDNGVGRDRVHMYPLSDEQLDDADLRFAIVERIVERHGGRLWIDAARGVGTTGYFTVPQGTATANREGPRG